MKTGLRLTVGGIILGWLAYRTDWSQVVRAFTALDWWLWLAGVGLYLLVMAIGSLRWQLLAEPLGFQHPLRDYLSFTFIGMFFGLFLPSIGSDFVRGWYLDGNSGRRGAALVSVLLDRVVGLAVLLGIACLALLYVPIDLPGWLSGLVWTALVLGVGGGLAIPWLARYAPDFLKGSTLDRLLGLYKRPARLAGALVLSLGLQVGHVLVVWLIGQAIQVPVPLVCYGLVVPLVSLATLLPISVNGIGVRDASMVWLLAPWGVSAGQALLLVFLWFLSFTVAGVCGVGCYLARGAGFQPAAQAAGWKPASHLEPAT